MPCGRLLGESRFSPAVMKPQLGCVFPDPGFGLGDWTAQTNNPQTLDRDILLTPKAVAAPRDLCGLEFEQSQSEPYYRRSSERRRMAPLRSAPVLLGVLFTWRRSSVE